MQSLSAHKANKKIKYCMEKPSLQIYIFFFLMLPFRINKQQFKLTQYYRLEKNET